MPGCSTDPAGHGANGSLRSLPAPGQGAAAFGRPGRGRCARRRRIQPHRHRPYHRDHRHPARAQVAPTAPRRRCPRSAPGLGRAASRPARSPGRRRDLPAAVGARRLRVTILYDEPRVLLVPRDRRLAGKESVTLDDIAGEPMPRLADSMRNAYWRVDPRPDGTPAPGGPFVNALEDKLEVIAAGRPWPSSRPDCAPKACTLASSPSPSTASSRATSSWPPASATGTVWLPPSRSTPGTH